MLVPSVQFAIIALSKRTEGNIMSKVTAKLKEMGYGSMRIGIAKNIYRNFENKIVKGLVLCVVNDYAKNDPKRVLDVVCSDLATALEGEYKSEYCNNIVFLNGEKVLAKLNKVSMGSTDYYYATFEVKKC